MSGRVRSNGRRLEKNIVHLFRLPVPKVGQRERVGIGRATERFFDQLLSAKCERPPIRKIHHELVVASRVHPSALHGKVSGEACNVLVALTGVMHVLCGGASLSQPQRVKHQRGAFAGWPQEEIAVGVRFRAPRMGPLGGGRILGLGRQGESSCGPFSWKPRNGV